MKVPGRELREPCERNRSGSNESVDEEARQRIRGSGIGASVLILTIAGLAFMDSSAAGLLLIGLFFLIALCSYGFRMIFLVRGEAERRATRVNRRGSL